jgi:hypothetical protein
MNENDLCKKLIPFIQENHRDIKIGDKLKAKVEKNTCVVKSLLEHYKVNSKLSSPLVEYSRYILTNGTENEKIAFADGVKTKILIRGGELALS